MICEICYSTYNNIPSQNIQNCEFFCDTGEYCKSQQFMKYCKRHENHIIPIQCLNCKKECCNVCYKQYFLHSDTEPNCIYCGNAFDLEFLLGINDDIVRFSRTFVWGPLRKHNEKLLLDQIMLKLPIYQHKITQKNEKIRMYIEELGIRKQIADLNSINIELYSRFNALTNDEFIYFQENMTLINDLNNKLIKKDIPYEIHGKCINATCNGLINYKWRCGICDLSVCNVCYCSNDESHVCKKEDLKTMRLLKEISRPCPNCNQMIEKIEGCNQMWCTNCHIFFNWLNGSIIKKTRYVHNPEYVEWLKQKGLSDTEECNALTYDKIIMVYPNNDKILNYYRVSNEIFDEISNMEHNFEKKIEKHAFDYLLNKISKEKLKDLIQRNFKNFKKDQLVNIRRNCYASCIQSIIYYGYKLMKLNPIVSNELEIIKSLDNLTDYYIKNMIKIGKMFGTSEPPLSKNLHKLKLREINNIFVNLRRFTNSFNYHDHSNISQKNLVILLNITHSKSIKDLILFLNNNEGWYPNKNEIKKCLEQL